MTSTIKIRLSAMMFLEYAVPASVFPIFSFYLINYLSFAPDKAGFIMASPGLATIIGTLLASKVTGKYISAERLLVLCMLATAVSLLFLFQATGFWPVLVFYFLFGLAIAPTFGLTNSVALHHIRDAARDFGGIRMWGIIGWCVVAWLFGYFYVRGGEDRLPHALPLAAIISLALAFYAMSFRAPAESKEEMRHTSYRDVLAIFTQPGMRLLCVATIINSIFHQYYYFGMGPYLHQMGFADGHIMPAISLGQTAEFILLGLLGRCLAWLGMKRAIVLGVLAQGLRAAIFAVEGPPWLILIGLSLHGICYAFFFTTAYLCVEKHSTPQTRAGGQQVLTVLIAGVGPVFGFPIGGMIAGWCTVDGEISYRLFWLLPIAVSLCTAAALALGFPGKETAKSAASVA